jgi:D-lactate dehydrogenase (cytochrome)
MIDLVNRHAGLSNSVQPTLFLEFNGAPAAVHEQAGRVAAITREFGGGDFAWSVEAAERTQLWQARHNAYHAVLASRPGTRAQSTDVCVPISHLAEAIIAAQQDVAMSGLLAPIVGHVGDGNFHLIISIDPANPAEVAAAAELNRRIVQRALAIGGTCTGEHGIGIGKLKYMAQEHGAALDTMYAIKAALDPQGIMNPGKVLPPVQAA